jgi:hypothetical protein
MLCNSGRTPVRSVQRCGTEVFYPSPCTARGSMFYVAVQSFRIKASVFSWFALSWSVILGGIPHIEACATA